MQIKIGVPFDALYIVAVESAVDCEHIGCSRSLSDRQKVNYFAADGSDDSYVLPNYVYKYQDLEISWFLMFVKSDKSACLIVTSKGTEYLILQNQ